MKRLQHYLNLYTNSKLKEDGIVGIKTNKLLSSFIENEIKVRNWQQPYTDLVWLRYDRNYNNSFNDFCVLYYRGSIDQVFHATTTAGNYWIYNPVTVGGITGTANLVEQQVINSHKWVENNDWSTLWLGMPYAKQVKDVTVYRDGNKDLIFDRNVVVTAKWWQSGINFHQMGAGTVNWNWSAGCLGTSKKDWGVVVNTFNNNDLLTLTLIEL